MCGDSKSFVSRLQRTVMSRRECTCAPGHVIARPLNCGVRARNVNRERDLKTNYLLIDFENVQPSRLSLLNGHPCKIVVFLGTDQTKIPVELAKTLQAFGQDAEYLQISGNGRNALDFHIAFKLGELSKENKNAIYHIISKDSGFDPLSNYLKKKGIRVHRSKDITDIPLLRVSNSKNMGEKIEAIVRNLKMRGSGRPRMVKTLRNTINALFSKSLNDTDLTEIVEALKREGYISIEKENVSYQLQSPP